MNLKEYLQYRTLDKKQREEIQWIAAQNDCLTFSKLSLIAGLEEDDPVLIRIKEKSYWIDKDGKSFRVERSES